MICKTSNGMKKTLWIIVIIGVIIAGWWLWSSRSGQGPASEGLPLLPEVSEKDTTAVIQQNLEQIDLGDIDQEFQSIDAELNGL